MRLTAGAAGYLPQEPDRAPGERLSQYLARRTGVAAADARVHAATGAMAARTSRAPRTPTHTRSRLAGARRRRPRAARGGGAARPRARPGAAGARDVALSGGQAARAALAAILLSRFDLLLLDEPTNDLDFDGLDRLERFVAERPGGAVIVSHDRAFLEGTVTRVLELDEIAHTAAEYGGGWTGYLQLRATAARHAEERYETFATERDRLADRARRQRQWSETGVRNAKTSDEPDKNVRRARTQRSEKQASKVRATEKALERLDEVDKPWRRWELQLRFGGGERSGDVTAASTAPCCDAAASSSARWIWSSRGGSGSRWSGPNGSGKTTLVDALLGRLPLAAGGRWLGPGVRPGTLDQARAGFAGGASLLDAFVDQSGLALQDARSLLAKFGLESDAAARPADTLSPGERTRAGLARLMASGANFLVLDEPTNHLDLPAIEQLEAALGAYEGTLLLVTHDRRLLDAVELDRTVDLGSAVR